MIRPLAILGAAALALAGALGARATVLEMPPVNDGAVMEGMARSLSEYRFFNPEAAQIPNGNVIPYSLNTPLYSDGADKLRFIYLPEGKQLTADGEGLLQFPVGSAIIKTFAFGEGKDRKLIETRVLLHRADGWAALPYRWSEDQSDAKLALAGGRVPITRPDGSQISYRIPNKNQCKQCHSKDGEVIPIGPKVRNLSTSWLNKKMAQRSLASAPALERVLPVWSKRGTWPVEDVARAYLDVNCAHCHQPGGSASNSGLDLRWEQDDPHALGIGKPPVAAGRGAGGYLVSIAPGSPDSSILTHRMGSTDPGVAMPELGKSTIDEEGLAVITRWIAQMEQ